MADQVRPPSDRPTTHQRSGHAVYEDLHASADFQELRRRYRSFAVPWTIAFLVWYLLYVVMSNWATDFMDTKLLGHINVALVFGLLHKTKLVITVSNTPSAISIDSAGLPIV